MKILYVVNRKVFPENTIIAIKPDDHIFTKAELDETVFKILQIKMTQEEADDISAEGNGIISEDGTQVIRKEIKEGESKYELYVKETERIAKMSGIKAQIIPKEEIKTTLTARKNGVIIKEIIK